MFVKGDLDCRELLETSCEAQAGSVVDGLDRAVRVADCDREVSQLFCVRQEVGCVDFEAQPLRPVECVLFEVSEQRRVSIELFHPFGGDVFVIVEAVHDAVFVFILEAVCELEHFESAES